MKFSDIQSHDDVKMQLRSMVDTDRFPHAILLEGPSGIGKFKMARALAQYIHCTNRTPDGDSCGVCPSCIQHQSFNHVDTHFSFPVLSRGANTKPVSDDWIAEFREFMTLYPFMDFPRWQEMLGKADGSPIFYVSESESLIHKLNFTSHAAKYMIVIMWLPERMNEMTANKLLKIIEEPHADTKFILVSNDSSKILPTIYSRLRRIEMKRLPDAIISDYLKSKYSIDADTADIVAHLAEGSILQAEKRLDAQADNAVYLDFFIRLMRDSYLRKIREMKAWSEEVAKLGREKSVKFLEYCERIVGENYIYNLRNPQLYYLDSDEAKFSKNFARFINYKNVEDLRQLFINARRDIAGNCNAKIVLFDVAVKNIMLIKRGS